MNSVIKKKEYWGLIIFFPIYFSLQGLYKKDLLRWGADTIERGAIFPLAFFCAVFIAFMVMIYYIKRRKVEVPRLVFKIILFYSLVLLITTIVGISSKNYTLIVAYGQLASGITGIILALWFFQIKKLDFIEATGFISKLFLFNGVLNFIYEATKGGLLLYPFKPTIPSTPFWGIYHAFVYYPMIFSLVMVFAIPYWKRKLNFTWFYSLYLGVLLYLWMYQVRTALLSYLVIMFIYVVFYEKNKRLTIGVTFLAIMAVVYLGFFTNFFQESRLNDIGESIENVGGRENIYGHFFNNIIEDPLYLLTGSVFDYAGLDNNELIETITTKKGVRKGYHNQYFESIADGGIFYLIFFLSFIVSIIKTLKNYLRHPGTVPRNYFSFWLAIIFVQMAIDLFFQVPFKVTNPSLIYWFYWIGVAFYAEECIRL